MNLHSIKKYLRQISLSLILCLTEAVPFWLEITSKHLQVSSLHLDTIIDFHFRQFFAQQLLDAEIRKI